jgi:hypothetical protein
MPFGLKVVKTGNYQFAQTAPMPNWKKTIGTALERAGKQFVNTNSAKGTFQ